MYDKLFVGLATFFAFSFPLSKALISIVSGLFFLLWLSHAIYTKKLGQDVRLLWSMPLIKIFVVYVVFACISLFWVEDIGADWRYRISILLPFILVVPPLVVNLEPKHVPQLITAFLMGMLVSEIVTYGIFFEWWSYHGRSPDDPSPFMFHIEYSTLLAFTSLLLLNRFFTTSNRREKILYTLFFISVTINLFISAGRTGQVVFLITLFIVILSAQKHIVKTVVIFSTIVTISLGAAWFLNDAFQKRVYSIKSDLAKIQTANNYNSSVGIRIGAYAASWELFKEKPLLGYGWVGHANRLKRLAKEDSKFQPIAPHLDLQNEFLFILAQFGLVGLVGFLYFGYTIYKLKLSFEYQQVKIIFLSVMVLYFMSEGWVQSFLLAFGTLFIALFLILTKQPERHLEHP